MLVLAHAGHFVWILYLVPVLIVGASILMNVRRERREGRESEEGGDDSGSLGGAEQLAEPPVKSAGE